MKCWIWGRCKIVKARIFSCTIRINMIRFKVHFDTIMTSPTLQEQSILSVIREHDTLHSSQIFTALRTKGHDLSLVTVKRALAALTKKGWLSVTGAGRSTAYILSISGRICTSIDAKQYCAMEPDRRYGRTRFDMDFFDRLPAELFTDDELHVLEQATQEFIRRGRNVSPAIAKKELERLVIELSWKSSKIEGNTYTLLDTERLILEHREAPGHDSDEAQMILNHKESFTLIHDHTSDFRSLTKTNLEELHSVLARDLGVTTGLRKGPVGVTGSRYQPLDNVHQITDAIQSLCEAVARMQSPYAKALLALLGISYIQPFEDGNKRTSRLMANALLLAHGCAPLSYRSVNENDYREATLAFYELNTMVPFKRIFIEQYDFAARNYVLSVPLL